MNNGAGDRLERLERLVEANQQQIAATSLAVERLADVVMQIAVRVDNQVTAMNTELERQGRILDYLMRRDGGNERLQ